MKKTLVVLGCLSLSMAHAQQDYEKRVGVNTDKPRASLEVRAIVSGNKAQGILFPHISEDEKAEWLKDEAKGLVAGTVIWNTTKLCLDYFDGTNWQCTDGTKINEHPTPWKPGATSFTGKAVWGDDAGEVISIAKNNCPAGQTGILLNYPANTAQHITYTATSNVSQADADQKALALMNAAEKQQERQRLAQEYANQNGTCKADTPDNTPVTLPEGVTIANGEHWIVSILDNAYLPYTMPDAPASWTDKTNPNAGTDKNIDVKGQVPAAGITVKIPVTVTSGSPSLPAYKAYVTTVAEAWKDGQAKILELSWEPQTLSSTTKTITATIKVKDATTNQELTQLDLRNGLGNDYKGLLLGQFKMPKNHNETTGTTYTGTYDVRVISGIPDKNINKQVNGAFRHQFIYLPVTGPDGKLWLNNNLGADYSNINSPHFDITKQAENLQDYKAYGSLFQFGRDGDGHELMTWTSATQGTTTIPTIAWIYDVTKLTYTADSDPCPVGWRTPDMADVDRYAATRPAPSGSTNSGKFWDEYLKFPNPGIKNPYDNYTLWQVGVWSRHWTRNETPGYLQYGNDYQPTNTNGMNTSNSMRKDGAQSIRCIKD